MHRPIFGHSFAVLVAPVLLSVLAFHFLNKKRTSARRNAEDVDTGASGSMAAPTETNSLTGNCYEVFLSFRGSDTRYGFTDHLYKGLVDAGIDAFRDDDELSHGEDIRPVLMEAITSSKILIPIFSVNYGTSSWCLNELVQMMECNKNNGQIVLPIFYKVKPAEVRYQTGRFGEAFHERENRLRKRSSFDPATLEKWKKALIEISTLKGYEAQGYEAKLVKLVVQKVLTKLKKRFELVISENLVGIDSHVNKVMEFVDSKFDATLFVGIYGMGGIGKTTLAKTIFNKLSNQFEFHSFIADIRESCKYNCMHYLQNQLIYDILKRDDGVPNMHEGIKIISSKFKRKKVLVLLDDVDEFFQLKCLAGGHDWFSLGSKIIITTRDKRILEEAEVDYTYEHKEMEKNQSLILFSKHAFRRDSPPRGFEDLTHEVVSIAGGLPLSLEVFGSLLCGKKSTQWTETIKKLKRVSHTEVKRKLRISYEALDYTQKQIFLDIACFFIDTDKITASYMWDACNFFPGEGIETLIFMSLIKVGNDHKLRMHNQLRDLGREIVREENQWGPWCCSRIWDYKEAREVLKEKTGTERIEAIDLSKGNLEDLGKTTKWDADIYRAEQFENMKKLRFLHLEGAHLNGDFKNSMEGLRWLQWPYCPMNFKVSNFHVKELVVLELSKSQINEKWEGWSFFLMAKKLKSLDLSYCDFFENMDFLSAFKKLEVLILNGCKSLTELPAEIGNLENLEILDICSSGIEELPNSIRRLRKLRELRASNCKNLKGEVAESMCNFSSLQHLDFLRCFNLQLLSDLPSNLIYLGITCRSHKLPWLSHLTHLQVLQVCGCKFLECVEVLSSTLLRNSECSQPMDVEELESPQSLNTPFKLEVLDVQWCRSIKTVDVSQFIHLRTLSTKYCENLLEVQGLDKSNCLESLFMVKCNSIERLGPLKFKGLKTLNVRSCKKLVEIQGLDRLENLESINIQECTSIKMLDLPKFGSLKELNLQGCENLIKIQGLDRLDVLESVNISSCTAIKKLLLPKSKSLKKLYAQQCKKLAEIQGLDRSEYLERLDVKLCTSITRLLLPTFGRLKELEARECKNLTEIQNLNGLKFLERLDIFKCTSIGRLDLPKSENLKELEVEGCENLTEIQDLVSEYLEMLSIKGCISIGRLLLPNSGRLKELEARDCKNLVEIQGLNRSGFLERLDIFKCSSIKRLDLPESRSLKILYARSCKGLAEIRGLESLEFLERLDISRCTSIERLLLPKSKSLKILKARYCQNLVEIQGLDKLKFLEELNIIGCKSLEPIPELLGTRVYRYYEIAYSDMIESGLDYMDDSDEFI